MYNDEWMNELDIRSEAKPKVRIIEDSWRIGINLLIEVLEVFIYAPHFYIERNGESEVHKHILEDGVLLEGTFVQKLYIAGYEETCDGEDEQNTWEEGHILWPEDVDRVELGYGSVGNSWKKAWEAIESQMSDPDSHPSGCIPAISG